LFNKAYYESTYNNFMNFFRRPVSLTTSDENKKANYSELDLEPR
jgi:hypothetical protein